MDYTFCATVNFELEYFLNEETESGFNDIVMNLQSWHL